jgi:hypothetical protein
VASFAFDWLIQEIRDGTVVPVIGSELYAGADGAPMEPAITMRLAKELGLPEPSPFATLRDIALACQLQGKPPPLQVIRGKLRDLTKDLIPSPPPALVQLAEIAGIHLYLTTALDDMLEQALEKVGRPAVSIGYSPTKWAMDLPDTRKSPVPVVCHVLGKFSEAFALTDADVIEYLRSLLGDTRRPTRLFEELADRNLLFLGCGFPDWLSRLFIRVIKDAPFSRGEPRPPVIADATIKSDSSLALFLNGHELMLYPPGSPPGKAIDFVGELHDEWKAQEKPAAPVVPPPADAVIPDGAVFLSFSSEDRETVRTIAAALHAAGIDIWFDETDLHPGVDWDRVIADNVRRAVLFVPFISQRTQRLADVPKDFWKEWNLADKRAEYYPPETMFILPVGLDQVDPQKADIPSSFRTKQWFWLTERTPTPKFIEYIRDAYRRKQLARRQ